MRYFDQKFLDHKFNYILQSILATATLFVILLFLNIITEAAIITALGASSFIVFAMPHHYSSKSSRIIGGYAIGLLIGLVFDQLTNFQLFSSLMDPMFSVILFASIAVGISIFIMVIFNREHAPACGIALGLVINEWSLTTIIFIIGAIFWLTFVKTIAKKWLIDLTQ